MIIYIRYWLDKFLTRASYLRKHTKCSSMSTDGTYLTSLTVAKNIILVHNQLFIRFHKFSAHYLDNISGYNIDAPKISSLTNSSLHPGCDTKIKKSFLFIAFITSVNNFTGTSTNNISIYYRCDFGAWCELTWRWLCVPTSTINFLGDDTIGTST